MRKALYLLLISTAIGIALCSCAQPGVTREQAVDIATKHLQKYGHYPATVLRVEAQEGEGWTNRYWERFGQPPTGKETRRLCWVVRFYYPGLSEDSHLVVFVDKRSGEVIGGTQTK